MLPFTVAVVVPIYVQRGQGPVATDAPPMLRAALLGAGFLCAAIGLALFASSLHHFVTRGRGTLAPWDPPRRLVVSGPYRWVRNPMISGVIFVLFAEAAVLRSEGLLIWAATFVAMNVVYIPLIEEPG